MKMFVVQISDPYASHGLTRSWSSMGVRVGRYLFYGGIARRSLSLFVEYLDEKSPSSIQEGGIAVEMVAMTIMGIFLKIETLDRNERWLNKFLM